MNTRNTYLIYAWDGWHEFYGTANDAASEAQSLALDGCQRGEHPRAYLFALPFKMGANPARVEYDIAGQPINLPQEVADCCTLYVATSSNSADTPSSLGQLNVEMVRSIFSEHLAPAA